MSNITEEQKAEFLKYYPDHEDKLEEIIEYNCLSSCEDDRIFCFMMLNLIQISQHQKRLII